MRAAIIALSKDWDDDPTSNHHVLRELAQHCGHADILREQILNG